MHDESTAERDQAVPPEDPREPVVPRQRWRLVLARSADAPTQTQRELAEAWEAAIVGAGLPLARTEGATARPRISFGAPLPVGMAADAELIDVVLTERLPVWQVREALTAVLPDGWRLVDLQDVWLLGPPLAGRVAAADYRIRLAVVTDGSPSAPGAAALEAACRELLAARRLERERTKGTSVVSYDLRPLVIDVGVVSAGPPVVLLARTRFHPELGTGRPEEVVAALATIARTSLEVGTIVRERLLLAEDLVEAV